MDNIRTRLKEYQEELDKGMITPREFELINEFLLPIMQYGEHIEKYITLKDGVNIKPLFNK